MKSSKILFTLLTGMFLISFASATSCYTTFVGTEISRSTSITEGDTIDFEVNFISFDPSIYLNIKMYDSDYNLVYTFENKEIPTTPSYKTYSITPAIYDTPGIYNIIVYGYDVELTLTVNAVPETLDTTAPILTLLGDNPVTIEVGETYTDAGATALDETDGDLTSAIIMTSTVNINAVGIYAVTYNVQDSSGNAAIITRIVNVVDDDNDDDNDDDDNNGNDSNDDEEDGNSYYEQLYLEQVGSKTSSSKTIYLNEYIEEEQKSWFQKLIDTIINFFRKLFGN